MASSTTKYLLAEQLMARLAGGYPDTAESVQHEDIYKALEQILNRKFKLEYYSATLPSGDTIPNGACLATYEAVAVTSFGNGKSRSTLPITPISLPRGIGVFEVRAEAPLVSNQSWAYDKPFIPLQAGQQWLLKSDKLLNDVLGQVAYEWNGKTLVYNKDLPLMGISTVTMKLVVFDISVYSETDILPIPGDLEADVLDELIATFAPVQPESGINNNFTTATNKA